MEGLKLPVCAISCGFVILVRADDRRISLGIAVRVDTEPCGRTARAPDASIANTEQADYEDHVAE